MIIPADRRIDWTYCGIPGGIPNRTAIYTTLNPGATAAQINTAISNCPSGQVVYLNAGTYSNIGEIKHKSNVTLRGAGPGRTIINSTSTGYGITSDDCWTYTNIPMTSGYVKGSTSVVVASSSGFQVGNTIIFEQNDDTRIVMATGGPGRYFKTHAIITGINGNTISFTPPLPYTLSATLSPTAGYWSYGNFPIISAGIESLTINAVNSMNALVKYYGSHRCWIKNVELSGLDNIGVWVPGAVQFEMRRCYIHDARNAPANTDGYGVYLQWGASYCLIEDNIMSTMSAGVYAAQTSSNAILYNLSRDSTRNNWGKLIEGMLSNHGAYGMMSLWEGNVIETFLDDGYHGSCGYQTVFRNQIHGVHPRGYTENRKMVGLSRGAYFYNVIANVLGDPTWRPSQFELNGEPGYDAGSCVYALGYPNGWSNGLTEGNPWPASYGLSYPDTKVRSTLLRHGNYDYFNQTAVWDPAIPDHTIPASLFYSSKPAYFGALQWPPIGPDVAGLVTDIPAKARWDSYTISRNKNDLF